MTKKILIVRFSSIGDVVLTTPVIRCVKEQLDNSEVHYVTKEQFRQVLENNPHIHTVHTFRKDIDEIKNELIKENFDFIIDLHNNLRSFRLKRILRKQSGTFSKINFRKWLMVNLKINSLPDIHIVDRYFQASKKLGITNDKKGLDYFITANDQISLPFEAGTYVAIAIGAQHATKRLPVNKLQEILKKLKLPVILLGGKEDAETGEKLEQINPEKIKNYCGKITLNNSAYVVSKSGVVITHDTGLMHIAAAFHKKIISIWGNTIPEFGMYPYMPGEEQNYFISEVKGLSCRPCSKIGYNECPLKHFRCMNDQDTDLIIDRAEKSL